MIAAVGNRILCWAVAVLLTLSTAWVCVAAVRGVFANPFATARSTACELGDWNCDDVYFKRGNYSFRLLFTDVEAELVASVGDEDLAVEIEPRHTPLVGWRVRRFSTLGSTGQAASRPGAG